MTDFIERIERLEEEKAGIAGDMGEVLADHKLWLDTDGKEGKRADLERANLERAYLSGANLEGAYLSKANLERANLQGTNLRGVNLYRANLRNANLEGANLVGANLRGVNLYRANLEMADLAGADLYHTTGNMKEIKSLQLDTYSITYTFDRLQIGCENHSIEEWKGFSDETIKEMDSMDLEWWKKYRDHIFKTIELSPAIPTGHEEKE